MKKAFLLLAIFLISQQASFAAFDTPRPSPWTKKTHYSSKTIEKLGFGMMNLTMGWAAMPQEMDKNTSRNPYSKFFRGLYLGAIDTVGGALHVVTFPIPVDIPLPAGGIKFQSRSEKDLAAMALPVPDSI